MFILISKVTEKIIKIKKNEYSYLSEHIPLEQKKIGGGSV